MLHAEQGPGQIDRDRAVPGCERRIEDALPRDRAGIVDKDVKLAELAQRRRYDRLPRRLIGAVLRQEDGPAARLGEAPRQRLAGRRVDIGQHDRRARAHEQFGFRRPLTAGRAGDPRHLLPGIRRGREAPGAGRPGPRRRLPRPDVGGCCRNLRRRYIFGRVKEQSPPPGGRDDIEQKRLPVMATDATALSVPWYRSLTREQWRVLAASNLAWLFDGFEIYALFLTVGFALHQLLSPAEYAAIPRYAGYVLATTVFGWATGGVIGGVIADYLGRKRTMMLAILAYSLTTGLSALAWNWESFAILRFLVGVGIGSEWATGASIVSELWPDHARGRGGGILQSGAGIGSFLASGVWLAIGGFGPNAWRFMYLVGILPALLVLWIWRGMPESARWEQADARRRAAREMRRSGAALAGEHAALTRFTLLDMFLDKSVRRRLVFAFLMMLSVTFGFWGVATFVPTYVGMVAAKAHLPAP